MIISENANECNSLFARQTAMACHRIICGGGHGVSIFVWPHSVHGGRQKNATYGTSKKCPSSTYKGSTHSVITILLVPWNTPNQSGVFDRLSAHAILRCKCGRTRQRSFASISFNAEITGCIMFGCFVCMQCPCLSVLFCLIHRFGHFYFVPSADVSTVSRMHFKKNNSPAARKKQRIQHGFRHVLHPLTHTIKRKRHHLKQRYK